jgi:uncharacterized protein HemX
MNQFERDLRESLRPRQPPPDFAEGVLARAHRSRGRKTSGFWLGAAALVVVLIGGPALWEQHRQREGEKTKDQLIVALRITGSKLRSVQERLETIQQRAIQPQLSQ